VGNVEMKKCKKCLNVNILKNDGVMFKYKDTVIAIMACRKHAEEIITLIEKQPQ